VKHFSHILERYLIFYTTPLRMPKKIKGKGKGTSNKLEAEKDLSNRHSQIGVRNGRVKGIVYF
jgi:hypothetical protein